MSAPPPTDKQRLRLACCRPDAADLGDRRLREALLRMAADPKLQETFAVQTDFDGPMAALVQHLPLPAGFDAEVAAGRRRAAQPRGFSWRSLLWQPAAWAVGLAFLFLLAWAGVAVYQHFTGFAGDDTVRQIIEYSRTGANSTHLEPLHTECGRLGDTLFLQYGLEDYAVPTLFDRDLATGYRVFAKNEKFVAQVQVNDHDMTFLVFRADQQNVNIQPPGRWKFLHGDDWSAAVQMHGQIGFVAICHGGEAALRTFMAEAKTRMKRNKKPDGKSAPPTQTSADGSRLFPTLRNPA